MVRNIEIVNWEKFNGRRDVKQSSWFRMEHSLAADPQFYALDAEEKWFMVSLFCLASAKNSGVIQLSEEHLAEYARVPVEKVSSAIRKLEESGTLRTRNVRVTSTLRPRNGRVTDTSRVRTATDVRTDVRDERTDERTDLTIEFDFDSVWNRYPRKIQKTLAKDRFQRLIQTPDDFCKLQEALERFRSYHEGKGTEERFIPHFTSFLGVEERQCWRDWLDSDAGTSDIQPLQPQGYQNIADLLGKEAG